MSEFNRLPHRRVSFCRYRLPRRQFASDCLLQSRNLSERKHCNRLCCSIEKNLKVPSGAGIQFVRGFVAPGVFFFRPSCHQITLIACLVSGQQSTHGPSDTFCFVQSIPLISDRSSTLNGTRFDLLARMSRKQQLDGHGLLSKASPTGFEPNWTILQTTEAR